MIKYILLILFFSFNLFSKSLQPITLQFNWKNQFEFAGYYMAKEKGFYKDIGLDVKFKEYQFGMNVTNEVTNKNATYAVAGSDLIIDIANGANIKLLSAIFQSSPLVLLTTEKSNIKSIQDFKNKKIMLTPDTMNSITYNSMLHKENLSFNDMQIIKHSFNIDDLISGKVDLYQSYITNEPFALKQAGIKPIIFDPKDYGFDFYSDILFTSENEIKNHRQRAIMFKEATLKGWEYAFNNIEESVDVIIKKYNSQNKSRESLIYEAKESRKLAYAKNKSLGEISLNKLQRMSDLYNILNLIQTPVDIKNNIFIQTKTKSQDILLTKKETEFLENHSTLTVSNELDYPPYDFFENSEAKGYSVDLMKLLAKKLNINIKFETDSWNNLVKKFCDGQIDILHPSDKSEEIVKCAEFTTAIIKDTSQFMIRSDFKKVNSLKDLYGYTIATPKGWQQTEFFKNEYKDRIKTIEVNSSLEAIEKVRSGEADFVLDYGNVLRYLKSKHNFNGLKVEGTYSKNSSFDNLYIAVNKKREILKDIFQKAINSISVYEITQLQDKWFGTYINENIVVNLTNKEKEFIKKHPSITLGYSILSQPLIIDSKNGSLKEGFVIDLAKTIKEKTGLNIEFKKGIWKDLVKKAKNKEIDGLAVTVSKEENRKKYFNFTNPYIKQTPIIFVKRGNPLNLKDIKSLKNRKMAILSGVEAMENIANKVGAKKVYFDNIKDVINSVITEETDFSLFFENIFFIANSLGLNYIDLAFPVSKSRDGFFSIRNDYKEAQTIINKVIDSLPTYALQNSKNKWFDKHTILPKVEFSKEEQNYLNNKKSINICVHNDLLPYGKINKNGDYQGIVADIFKIFKNNSTIDFKIAKTKSWSENLKFIQDKKCDLLTLAANTKKRQEYLNFTKPYLDSPYVVLTKSDKIFIDDINSIIDKKVAVDKDYSTIELLKKRYPKLKIRSVKNIEEGVRLVQEGEVYGYINILSTVAHHIQKHSLVDIKINGKFNEKAYLSMATRKDEPLLNNIMQKLLDSVSKDEKQEIINKWIAIKYEEGIDYSLIWKIVLFFTLGAILLIYRLNIVKKNKEKLQLLIKEEVEKSRKKDNLLFQQNKMASLGNMIATIAHQWRQPLSQLSMSQNILLRKIEMDDMSEEELKSIINDDQKVLQFMSSTINTFQNFYKEDFDEEEIFNLDSSYTDVKYILLDTITLNKIELIENIDKTIEIKGCKNYISQILLAILQNSIYFLKSREITNPKIYINIEKIDNQIEISIENNDKGINENIIDKIFDYNFSRRGKYENSTGLGLYIVKLIVEEKLNGKIKAQNAKDGAKFIITFDYKP